MAHYPITVGKHIRQLRARGRVLARAWHCQLCQLSLLEMACLRAQLGRKGDS